MIASPASPKKPQAVVARTDTRPEARATDPAGNTGPKASREFTVDTVVEGTALAKSPQRQSSRGVIVKAKVRTGEQLTTRLGGRVQIKGRKRSYQLKPITDSLAARTSARFELELKTRRRDNSGRILRALGRGKKVRAKLKVKLVDEAGNRDRQRLRVKLEG